jgi:hypothetical protein
MYACVSYIRSPNVIGMFHYTYRVTVNSQQPTYLPNYQSAYYKVCIEYVDSGLADYANKNVTLREQIRQGE